MAMSDKANGLIYSQYSLTISRVRDTKVSSAWRAGTYMRERLLIVHMPAIRISYATNAFWEAYSAVQQAAV
jgi:hypothetical protein